MHPRDADIECVPHEKAHTARKQNSIQLSACLVCIEPMPRLRTRRRGEARIGEPGRLRTRPNDRNMGETCHTRRGHFRRRVRCENATRKALVKIYRQRARTCAYIEYPQRGIKIAVTSLAHVAREEINNLSGVARAHRTIVRHPAVKGVGSFHTVLGGGKSRAITLRSGRNLLAGRIRRPRWCHRVRIAIGRMRKAASIRVYMHNTSPTVAASIIIVSD